MSESFAALKLHDALLAALNEAGYTEPTPIQAQAIPIALAGKDLVASAQTGTGKTAAFLLPGLHRLTQNPAGAGKGPRILVLTPTRELARQVESAARVYGSRLKIRTASILGGMNYQQQARQLARPVDVMVATPGRLLDLMNRGQIKLNRVELLVLDEADRMLDLGFIEDVELIASQAPAERQTMLFSATFENRIVQLANTVMREPERLEITPQTAKHENIEQRLYFCDDVDHKKNILLKLLDDPSVNQSVVFTATRRDAEELCNELTGYNIQAASLHGDMKQPARNRTLRALKDGAVRCLVATDVAARGIDVVGISHVFNFDLPMVLEDYVHRIGRTGRAGRSGVAISLVNRRDRSKLRKLAEYTGNHIPESVIPGMEPKPAPKRDGRDSRDGRGPGRGAGTGLRRGRGRDDQRQTFSRPRRDEGAPAYANELPAFLRESGPRDGGQRDSYGPARAARPARPRSAPSHGHSQGHGHSQAANGNGGRRFRSDEESFGNRAEVATHERSAFDRKAMRQDRQQQRMSHSGIDFRARSAPARRSYNNDAPASANASRPQPQVRVIRSRDNRASVAWKAKSDDMP